jgi:hypothetical protein
MTTLILNTAANEYASPVKQYSSSNANYDTARNAVSVAPTNQGVVQPGQFHRSTPMYWVERSLLGYNLTNLPPGSVISSAILSNTSEQCWASEAFDMVVLDGTGLTGVAGDFGAMKLLTTSLGSCSFPADGLKDYAYSITLNAAGRALIQTNAGGAVHFAFRTNNEIAGTPPGDGKTQTGTVDAYNASPYTILTIEYSVVTLAVQTDPATNISSTNAQLNGTLTDDNSNPPINVHFDAGTTSACSDWSGGAHSVNESESFAATIVDLTPGVTYYFRAVAVDGANTVYGAVLSFTVASFPLVPTSRVSSIVHRVSPGAYNMEIMLGGFNYPLTPNGFINGLPIVLKRPMSSAATLLAEDLNLRKQQVGPPNLPNLNPNYTYQMYLSDLALLRKNLTPEQLAALGM